MVSPLNNASGDRRMVNVMIYRVADDMYYNSTGMIGDQRYA